MEKTLKERKQELVKNWEEIFEKNITEALTVKGLERFWSDDTPYEEAGCMLDNAAILEVVTALENEVIGVAVAHVSRVDKDDESETPYEVERTTDHYFFEEKFKTKEDAKQFIEMQAMATPYTIHDFRVVKVVEVDL